MNSHGFWSSDNARDTKKFGYNYAEIRESTGKKDLQVRVANKYKWSSQAYNNHTKNPTIPPEMKPLDLTDCPVFKFKTGTLDSRLSREIQVISKQEVSKTVLAPTVQNQHIPVPVPKVTESETTINVAALNAPTTKKSALVVKRPALDVKALTPGRPNETNEELTSGKAAGTNVLRQWYIDTIVQK